MASRDEITLPATRPKSRKSLAHHVPSANTMNKENMTADIGAMVQDSKRAVLGDRKKSRSKSIGPGGLDALKDTSGNRRKSIAAPPPRSILKPTLPPLRDIPPHSSLRNSSPKKPNPPSNAHSNVESKRTSPTLNTANVTGSETLPNPFSASDSAAVGETRVMLRTEEEQQAAAREREAKEQEEVQKDIVARRDARRKSLANRRVSFAPEATLHTWDVVEYMQDSTTSSASTNSTRRASTMSNETVGSPHTPGQLSSDPSEPPSTPPEQIEDSAGESPADQRNLHQRKRRRSSGIPPLNFNNPDDEDFSSSPSDGSSMGGDDMNEEFDDDDGSDVNSDSDDDGTAMSIDGGDVTVTATDMSIASVMSSSSSTGSSARLEQALQLAAQQAGTQGIDFDEHGSLGIEEEEEEIIASFAPWSTKKNLESSKDQENVNPFSPAFKAAQSEEDEEDDGTTMEMTRAVGRIMPGQQSDDEMTMEMTKAVGCIMPSNEDEDDGTMEMTMEMTRAVGRIMPSDQSDEDGTMEKTRALGRIMPAAESDDEMTMDMTMAVGGIIQQEPQLKTRRKSVMPSRRQSTRRRSSAETSVDDETMDFTMAIGGIQKNEEPEHDSVDDEDMAMEFTSVIGGVLAAANPQAKRRQSVAPSLSKNRRQSVVSEAGDDEMDMTVAVGKILPAAPSSTPKTSPLYPDLQTALDGILPQPPSATRPEAKRIMEEEVDHAELDSSPFQAEIPVQPQAPVTTVASETGSPSLNAFRGKGLRRSSGLRSSTMPKPSKQTDKTPSPQRKPATPSKQLSAVKPTTPSQQLTPQPMRPTTPSKTPPSKNVSMRTGSPHKLFAKDTKSIATTPMLTPNKKPSTPNKLFQQNRETGAATPSIVLKPQRRRSSGVGIDKIGLGSPRLAAILDRRGSIGENAIAFQPAPVVDVSKVRFGEAASIEQELDKELQEEKDRESGRKLMEREANGQDEKDVTVNLKEMIESLTPKKRPLKGRKSLHVGAAKGILGKRPAELDEEDEEGEEDSGGVKRLKNHQGSPVKNVKLKAPPSKEETTGRVTRATRRSLEATAGNATTPRAPSPTKKVAITTPSHEGHFKDTSKLVGASQPVPFPMSAPAEVEEPFGEDRIQLQEFLNMTSIRFMELTTTKRRHTVAPNALTDAGEEKSRVDGQNDATLEACVVAGACTVPMLELFQHSCRELKKYISEGRSIVREIETETFEENPLLFQEYICATPDMRVLMDNQFKNVKTHARLLSKAMWYEWRMKLLDGLRAGLIKIAEGMTADADILDYQQELLDRVLPGLQQQYESLFEEEADLQASAEELANCDQEELAEARDALVSLESDIEAKRRLVRELRNQIEDKEAGFKAATDKKQAYLEDIKEAEKIREECRGWTGNEIAAYKDKVDALEEQYGWTVTGVSGTTMSLAFRGDLELVFDASSFKADGKEKSPQTQNSRLDLWYIAANRERNPLPETLEKKFFVDSIRDSIRALVQSETLIKELLGRVSAGWETSLKIVHQIEALNRVCPTEVTKTSDSSIMVRAMLLLIPLNSKVDLQFNISTSNAGDGLEIAIDPVVNVVYGEKFNEKNMTQFMITRVGTTVNEKATEKIAWTDAVKELEQRLLARGKKP